ncbi:MAG: hypothetical protein KDA75_02750 [Planctomycetaceae bacterium]|nr:hypothetical protein [Planctomycetaceae bacterium]
MIYETMTAPVLKEGLIVGWSDQAEAMYGRRPDPYVAVVTEDSVEPRSVLLDWDAFIMAGVPSADVPIEGLAAMYYEALLVVDDIPQWRSLVVDGKTGWLCRNEREFVYKASRCAFEREESRRMVTAARRSLLERFGDHPHVRRIRASEPDEKRTFDL